VSCTLPKRARPRAPAARSPRAPAGCYKGALVPPLAGLAPASHREPQDANRDAVYGRDFRPRARRVGIDAIATPIRSPWANAVVEGLIGTLRRECLDHLIVLDEQHLQSVLAEFVRYYNEDRPHRTLDLQTPKLGPRTVTGRIRSRPVLSGLHHVYERVA
jgi:Integrase core domain